MPALTLAALGVLVGFFAARQPDAEQLRDRLDAYLTAYQPELSTLLAREVMTQTIESSTSRRPGSLPPYTQRKLDSEVAFMSLPGEAGWLGIRMVRKVNGRPVKTAGPSIPQALGSGDAEGTARKLLSESAQYNLGTARNINLPNLPLELLHPRHRGLFDHSVSGADSIRGQRVLRLAIVEVGSVPLIRGPDGERITSRITAWITPAGELLRADVRMRLSDHEGPQREPTIRVEYKLHEELGLLVPVEMREEFTTGTFGVTGLGVAKYSEFRRFQTSARILPPPQ
jgi:hypothetical protein